MIRLTVRVQGHRREYLFNQSMIQIGSDPNSVDVLLEGTEIQPIHLKMIEQNGEIFLINHVNDPFASLNDQPFGKKKLSNKDIIDLDGNSMLFERIAPFAIEELAEKQSIRDRSSQNSSIENKQKEGSFFELPFKIEEQTPRGIQLDEVVLEKYLSSSGGQSAASSLSSNEKKQTPPKPSSSLKDDYLKDLEDEYQQQGADSPFSRLQEPSHLYQAWKWILVFIFSLLSLCAAVGFILYLTLSDKTEAQEIKASQAVADVAMALTYAQIHHLNPVNQNWSDPDFIKSNLLNILPETVSHASQIDAQGQLHCCPYTLRIYTSSDLSHFLLIAQPAPSLFSWLFSPALIVVDSHLMQLRIFKDVKSLSRLLAHQDPLDGGNGKEITSLIKREGLVHLSSLSTEEGCCEFTPPKALAWMKPGAENLIYNAPRYYRLAEHLAQRSLALVESKTSQNEVSQLKDDLHYLSSTLPQIVLYSDQGRRAAVLMRQQLALFSPTEKLLIGYILFNAQAKIHEVFLLKDDEEESTALIAYHPPQETAVFSRSEEGSAKGDNPLQQEASSGQIDFWHPVYIQLQSLSLSRASELTPLAQAITQLIAQDIATPRPQFQTELQNLSHSFLMADAKHKQAIKEALNALYLQYQELPIQQFLHFVEALKLDQLVHENQGKFQIVDENCEQNIELLLVYMNNAKSLEELDNLIQIATSWLSFDYVKSPRDLIKYENQLRNQILTELEKFILSSKNKHLLRERDGEVLEKILNYERFIREEEKEFFLSEFASELRGLKANQEVQLDVDGADDASFE